MIPSWIWNILAHLKRKHNFIIIGAGDWGQLPPVHEEHIDFENSWIVKYVFNYNLNEVVEVNEPTINIYYVTPALYSMVRR